jgi:hypothetical protein
MDWRARHSVFPGSNGVAHESVYSLRDNVRAKQSGDEDDDKLGNLAGFSSGRMRIKNSA